MSFYSLGNCYRDMVRQQNFTNSKKVLPNVANKGKKMKKRKKKNWTRKK